jgi:DNA-directed RNA polymerase specialized sigma24 family protein
MKQRNGPWTPEEYRVLHEENDARTTARLLGRNLKEVQRKTDVSFGEWYRRHRCPGSPERPDRILEMARRLYHEDGYAKFISDGELEDHILKQTQSCFKNFDPSKWRAELAIQEKFVRYFVVCFSRRLDRHCGRVAKSRREFEGLFCDVAEAPTGGGECSIWSQMLFRKALGRLKPQARRFIEFRFLEGLEIPDIAERMDLKVRTLYNKYSFNSVVELFRNEIRTMILELPAENAAAIVHYLHQEADLNEKTIAELLCIPRSVVDQLLDDSIERIMANMSRKQMRREAVTLLAA